MERLIEFLKFEIESAKQSVFNTHVQDYSQYIAMRSTYHTLVQVLEKAEELRDQEFGFEEDD